MTNLHGHVTHNTICINASISKQATRSCDIDSHVHNTCFRFDTGGGAVSLRTRDKLIINRKYTVRVERTGRSGQLGVEGHDPVYNEAPGSHTGLNIDPELLVGHVLTDQMEKIPKRLV